MVTRRSASFALVSVLALCLRCASKNDPAPVPTPTPEPEKPAPEFKNMSPLSGIPGIKVTIKGKHLNNTPGVFFGDKNAVIVNANDSVLVVNVPVLAATGSVKIKSGGKEIVTPSFKVHDVMVLVNDADRRIKVWRNGTYTDVAGPATQGGHGLAVSGQDIYVSGYTYSTMGNPTIWKNGMKTVVSNTQGIIIDVLVDGADVHGAGIELNGPRYATTYWKNGARTFFNTPLYDNNNAGQVIKLADGKIYVGGGVSTSNTTSEATYWVDQVPVTLSHVGTSAGIFDLTVKNGVVYAVGYSGTNANAKAVYWENDVYHELSDGSEEVYSRGITIHGNDLYIVGSKRNAMGSLVGSLWKNGVMQDLIGISDAYRIEFIDEDRVIMCYLNDVGSTPAILFNQTLLSVGLPNGWAADMVVQ